MNIAIATISRAQTSEEEALLRRSLFALSRLGHPVFITDGGSLPAFTDWLGTLPGFAVLPPAKGLVPQAASSLQAAAQSGAAFVLYTEPDKLEFFETALPSFLNQAAPTSETGVMLVARSAAAFASFPPFQQLTEETINRCCAEALGLETDYCYGPFLVNAALLPLPQSLPPDVGWGWRPYVFATAKHTGYHLRAVEAASPCPPSQRTDDRTERLYRMRQLEQNIRGLLLATEA